MKRIIHVIIILILLYPNWQKLSSIFSFSIPFSLIDEKRKFDNLDFRRHLDFIDNLSKLNGQVLVMSQTEPLNYTNLDVLYHYDERFLDIFKENKGLKNIKFVAVSQAGDPIMNSPLLQRILNDPAKSKIIFDSNDWKIFKTEATPSFCHYDSTKLQISFQVKSGENCIYTSHQEDHSYLFMPSRNNEERSSVLEPGLYDFICEMDVDVDRDTQMSLRMEPYFGGGGNQIFYLKRGKNHVLTRFLHTHVHFRLAFTSHNPQITFSNVNLSYALQEKLLSPKNVLFYDKNGMPLTIDSQGKSVLKNGRYEVLFFDKPFNKGETLCLKADGFGTIKFVMSSPSYMKHVRKLMRYEIGRWLLSKLPVKSYELVLKGKEKNLGIPFKEKECVIGLIAPQTNCQKQEVILKSLSIERSY